VKKLKGNKVRILKRNNLKILLMKLNPLPCLKKAGSIRLLRLLKMMISN